VQAGTPDASHRDGSMHGRGSISRRGISRMKDMIVAQARGRDRHHQADDLNTVFQHINSIEDDKEFLVRAFPVCEDSDMTGGRKRDPATAIVMLKKYGRPVTTRLYLSPAHDWVCWDRNDVMSKVLQKSSMAFIEISHIVRVETGMNTTNFARRRATATEEEIERSFSVVTHDRSLDLIASTVEYAKLWVRLLTLQVQQTFLDVEESAQESLFTRYLEEQWNRADTDRSGSLTLKELLQLMQKMNIASTRKEIKEKMDYYTGGSGEIVFEQFVKFMDTLMRERKEVKYLIKELHKEMVKRDKKMNKLELVRSPGLLERPGSPGASELPRHHEKERLTPEMLCHFFNEVQECADGKVWDEEMALELIRKLADDPGQTSMGVLQFAMMLDDTANSAYDPVKRSFGCGASPEKYMSQSLSDVCDCEGVCACMRMAMRGL